MTGLEFTRENRRYRAAVMAGVWYVSVDAGKSVRAFPATETDGEDEDALMDRLVAAAEAKTGTGTRTSPPTS